MSSLSLSSISSAFLPQSPSKPTIKNPTRIKLPPLSVTGKRYKGTAMREEMLTEMIVKKVAEAMEVCGGDEAKGSDGCRVAWDEVEEVSQAKAHLRRRIAESEADPLESFCEDNPETDECRVYED
ncbi:uncharacterized protein A4U43_C01F33770 [Asparagus officinalis]|uniref:CP12 domain-containing protein n=1 Tax=Asparagus officinalis TaxID=4686 RepID=A0A5P1FU78_ASPOF|nr:calvin cycle protein CP12-3, chloroplastic [Asparagus officinalis]ONK81876.1 uncharacterized protein A4U43_C01F33770 [Asparagus officinalis]